MSRFIGSSGSSRSFTPGFKRHACDGLLEKEPDSCGACKVSLELFLVLCEELPHRRPLHFFTDRVDQRLGQGVDRVALKHGLPRVFLDYLLPPRMRPFLARIGNCRESVPRHPSGLSRAFFGLWLTGVLSGFVHDSLLRDGPILVIPLRRARRTLDITLSVSPPAHPGALSLVSQLQFLPAELSPIERETFPKLFPCNEPVNSRRPRPGSRRELVATTFPRQVAKLFSDPFPGCLSRTAGC